MNTQSEMGGVRASSLRRPALVACCALLLTASTAYAEGSGGKKDSRDIEEIVVSGSRATYVLHPDRAAASPDVAELLKSVPGAAVVSNGTLSGSAQYRGLFGDRVEVRVDGVEMEPACTNRMDAPLSHLSRMQLETLNVRRGVAPVSAGPETLGGAIEASTVKGEFGDGPDFDFHGSLSAALTGADDGHASALFAAAANERHKLHLSASTEAGDDIEFPGGKIVPSEHRREIYKLGYAYRLGAHRVELDYRRLDTGLSGVPALPMDTLFVDSDIGSIGYFGKFAGAVVEGRLFANDSVHGMDNFSLRSVQGEAQKRRSSPTVQAFGWSLDATVGGGDRYFRFGADGDRSEHDARISNPADRDFFVVNFNDARRGRYGLWAEWATQLSQSWRLELGARYNLVETSAGRVASSMAMAAKTLEQRFNSADRSRRDHNFDWVAQLFYSPSSSVEIEAAVARKTRSPGYQQRYLWLPLKSTGGLADGKNYVGDVGLDPEVSHEVELGVDWRKARFAFSPRIFYRRINDYIQGVPATDAAIIMVSDMMGDPRPLAFANTDAELYGADAGLDIELLDSLLLSGTLSFVRGKRLDVVDNLYRIAPLNGSLALAYERDRWSLALESRIYARQDKVSATNEESPSGGYALFGLLGSAEIGGGVSMVAGVDNLFDRRYADHLGGVNRAADGDVPVGDRLPGVGRNFHLSVEGKW